MSFGYLGDTSTKINQKVKNAGVLSVDDIHELQEAGQLGGSLDFIANGEASSSTIDFVDKFSDYDIHVIFLEDLVTTTQTEIGIKFSNDSGSSYETSNYSFSNLRVYEDGTTGERNSTSQSSIRLGGDVLSNSEFNGYFYIFNANNSGVYTITSGHNTFLQGTAYAFEWGGGEYSAAEVVNGIRIGEGTGTTAISSGTARLYGLKAL